MSVSCIITSAYIVSPVVVVFLPALTDTLPNSDFKSNSPPSASAVLSILFSTFKLFGLACGVFDLVIISLSFTAK